LLKALSIGFGETMRAMPAQASSLKHDGQGGLDT
jgi:hypothetical protein